MEPLFLNEEFDSVLPPGWGTNIVGKRIVEGEDNFPNVELKFFIKCNSAEEFARWLMEFQDLTNSSYVIAATDIEDGARVKLKRRLRCHHFTRCTKTYDPSLKTKTRNTNCPSKLMVKIHVIRRKYRGKQEKFQFIHETPCEITLILTHNHPTSTEDVLRFRKVADDVKEELLSLYQNGHTAATALEMIKCNLQLTRDDYERALADRSVCPSYKYCYDLYVKEFKKKLGPMKFDTDTKMFLESKLMLYNATQENNCAKMVTIGEENVDYVIGICTPIMKRVHKHIEAASEIVFMDSSGTVDKDGSRIFVLLTHSECGPLPLGVIITSSECVDAIKCGFNILTELVGESIFGGHKEGPKAFMIDDSEFEQQAIFDTWPQAERMLSEFHVLQAVFRWLSNVKRGISKHQKACIYKDFQNILYSKNIEEMTRNYVLAFENAKSFPDYIDYLSNYWWPIQECWANAYKKDYANRYSEGAVRGIKDEVFSRIKAFNIVQIVDFMLTIFEDYTARRLLDAASNESRQNLLHRKIKMPPSEVAERITKLSDSLAIVPSETKPSLTYLVNIDVLKCSCIVGLKGVICKHIDWANTLFGSKKDVTQIDSLEIKMKLYFVATGQTNEDDWFSHSINKTDNSAESDTASLNELDEEDIPLFSEEMDSSTSIPTDSAVAPLSKQNGIEKKYTELLSDITQVFDKHFEKSPLEVTCGMEKMVATLNNIGTTTAFSSAIATFGCAGGELSEKLCRPKIES